MKRFTGFFILLFLFVLVGNFAFAADKQEDSAPPAKSSRITPNSTRAVALFEDFEAGVVPAGWDSTHHHPDSPGFQVGVKRPGTTGNNTNVVYVDDDELGSGFSTVDTLFSPSIDLSTYSTVKLDFWHYYNNIGSDSAAVFVVVNDANWYKVTSWNGDNSGDQSFDITTHAAGESNVKIAFFYDDGGVWAWYWMIDNVKVYEPAPNNYAVNQWVDFSSGVLQGNTEIYSAEVENVGTAAQTDVPIRFFEDGVQVGSDQLVSLAPGAIDTVYFNYTPAVPGSHTLKIQSFLAGDPDPTNDFVEGMVNVVGVQTLPFSDDFESSASLGNYVIYNPGSAVFEIDDASEMTGGPFSGDSALKSTDDTGTDENMLTLYLDLSPVSAARLNFAWGIDSYESGEYTVLDIYDGTWHTGVDSIYDGGPWTEDDWYYQEYDLSSYSMINGFGVRFRFKHSTSFDRGFIDALSVSEIFADDFGVSQFVDMQDFYPAGQATTIFAAVNNFGTSDHTNVPVRLFEDGVQVGSDVLVSLTAGQTDTVSFPYTPANTGTVQLTAQTFLSGDQNPVNDTLSEYTTIYEVPVVAVPWIETFPTTTFDPAAWVPAEFHGIPEIIDENGTSGGIFSYPLPSPPYMMEISGESSSNGDYDEAVTGEFDMSGLNNYTFSFWKSENDLEVGEYVLIQYLASGGSWKLLDSLAGTNNGYGSFEPFQLVEYPLPGDAYHSGLRFKFTASSGMSYTDEYFFDDMKLTGTIGWANLQWPPSTTINPGDTTELIFGQIWIDGVTPDPNAPITAELGYGPDASFPFDTATSAPNPDWTWVPAVFNVPVGNNNEYMAQLTINNVGIYDYAYRYSNQGGPWVYGDLDGINNGYDPAQAGDLSVVPQQPIAISELMYNPANLQGSDSYFEFVEVANLGVDSADVSGWQFTDGITYTFPAGTKIAGGEFLVVASNPDSVVGFYGIDPAKVVGPFSGGLSNSGEAVVLADDAGATQDSVSYDDDAPWPLDADGYGPSLEVIDLFGDNTDPANWNASLVLYGTPGAENQIPGTPTAVEIYDVQHTTDPSGISPMEGQLVEVSGTVTDADFVDGGIVVQDSMATWNGIQVLTRGSYSVGQEVSVYGSVMEFYDRTLLVGTQISVTGTGSAPDPLIVTPGMVNTGSPTAEAYEGVLIEVDNVVVSNDDAGFGEWEVTDGTDFLLVDNDGYDYTPQVGDSLLALRGILNFSFSDFKIAPRSNNDFLFPVFTLFEGFENAFPPAGWSLVNVGAGFQQTDLRVHSGAYSTYHNDDTGQQDDWLVSPMVDLTSAATAKLTFWQNVNWSSYADLHQVYATTDTTGIMGDTASWTLLYDAIGPEDTWEKVTLDLSAFAGQTFFFAFYYSGNYASEWYIDDVVVAGEGTLTGTVTLASNPGTGVDSVMVIAGTDTAYTDANGNYSMTIPGGIYTVVAKKTGYNVASQDFVVVIPGETEIVDFQLTAPTMDLDVTAIADTLTIGDSTQVPITVSNNGNGPVSFNLVVTPTTTMKTNYSRYTASGTLETLKKVKPENRTSKFQTERISGQDTVIVHFDGPYDNNGIGTNSAASWICAARFTYEELLPYYGEYGIAGVQLHIRSADFSNVTLKIWEGGSFGDPGAEVYSQDITSQVVVGDWTNYSLNEPIALKSGNEYWIGYAIDATGDYPSSIDAGPAVPGKGDWMFFGGQWLEISTAFGLDYNWNIRGVLTNATGYWLTVSPVAGTLQPGQQQVLTAKLDASLFSSDTMVSANINFTSDPDVGNPVIPVDLTVTTLNISGVVGLSDNPPDLSGTRVELVQGGITLVDSTDASGNYGFSGVAAGSYDMHFLHTGYTPFDTTITVNNNITLDVMLMKIVSPPTNVTANQIDFTDTVNVTWTPPGTSFKYSLKRGEKFHDWKYTLANSRDVLLGYNVYRSDDGGVTYNLLNTTGLVTDSFYVDGTVEFDSTYYYYVTGVYDPEGESDSSNVAIVTVYPQPGDILLVDDDASIGGSYDDVGAVYVNTLNQLNTLYGTTFDYYEVPVMDDGPDASMMSNYQAVIWITGETWNAIYAPTLTANDEANLGTYLDNGGRLFLVAQDYFWDVYPNAGNFSAGQFPYDYLGVTSTSQDAWADTTLTGTGVTGSFTEGMTFTVNTPFGTTILFVDEVVTSAGNYLFSHTSPSGNSGVYYDAGTFKTVFSTLEFGGFQDGTPPSTKVDFLTEVLKFLDVITGIGDQQAAIPTVFDMKQNYPNPFNPATAIKYQLPTTEDVKLDIYNVLGQKVRTLLNRKVEAGYHEVIWDGRNEFGNKVASGLYIYRIKAGDFVKTRKMILMK